jgi:hypothetical protein
MTKLLDNNTHGMRRPSITLSVGEISSNEKLDGRKMTSEATARRHSVRGYR